MILKENILFLIEQNILKTTATKPIVDAIKNRRKISFYYSGPRKPSKDSVKAGKRYKVEPVAIGLSKKGNLIIRAWVDNKSVSKKGFTKTNWRTFILGRASNIEITDETFDQKRPGYKEGDDGSMTVTYVTTDWSKKPRIKKYEKPFKTPQDKSKIEPKPEEKPEPIKKEPQTQELPQPKPEEKPEPIKKEPQTQELPQPKPEEKPEIQTQELPQPKPEEKPEETPNLNPEDEEDEDKNLQETIKRIKTLMFS